MQMEVRNVAAAAGQPPPEQYTRLFRLWFVFGVLRCRGRHLLAEDHSAGHEWFGTV